MGEEQDTTSVPPTETKPKGGGADSTPMIPKPRFDEVNTRLSKANERIAEFEAREAARSSDALPDDAASPGKETPQPQPEAKREDGKPLSEVEKRQSILEIRMEHQFSREAAEAILQYQVDNKLGLDDAIALARLRQPALFGEPSKAGVDAATHHTTPPASGPASPPSQEETPIQQLDRQGINLDRRQKMALGFAAKAVRAQMFPTSKK